MAGVRDPWIDGALLVLASPILAVKAVRRALERYQFFRLAMSHLRDRDAKHPAFPRADLSGSVRSPAHRWSG